MTSALDQLKVQWSDGSTSIVNGINRKPGEIRNCRSTNAGLTVIVTQDETCQIKHDLVAITPDSGYLPDLRNTTSVIIGPTGALSDGRRPLSGEILLVGIGGDAADLVAKYKNRLRASLALSYAALSKSARHSVYAVNGGPLLLHDGKPVQNDASEGWNMLGVDLKRANFVHSWTNMRNPRTAVGTSANRSIWLLVVEGREFSNVDSKAVKLSSGLTIDELRQVMAHLGASDAINLDGGGSSVLVVNGKPITRPSDPDGERAVGDAIVLSN